MLAGLTIVSCGRSSNPALCNVAESFRLKLLHNEATASLLLSGKASSALATSSCSR